MIRTNPKRRPFFTVCRHLITRLARKVKYVSTIFRIIPVVVLPAYAATGEIVESAGHKVEGDLVRQSPVIAMRIKSSGSGMVYRDRRDYSDLLAFALRNFGNRLQTGSIRSDAKHSIVCFLAARYGGSCGGGIRDDGVRRFRAGVGLVRHTVHGKFATAGL